MADLLALVDGFAPGSPCGDNLEYDPAFLELEAGARGKPEQQFGSTVVPAQAPDWAQVGAKAQALLARSLDLRVAVLLARSQTHVQGLEGLAAAVTLLHRLCAEYWDHVHPQLDPDDSLDPMLRMNALATLVDHDGLLLDLRDAAYIQAPGFGTCSVREGEVALGLVDLPEGVEAAIGRQQLGGYAKAAAAGGKVNAARLAWEAVEALQALLRETVGEHQAVDLRPLAQRLRPLALFYSEASGETGADARRVGGVGAPDSRDADASVVGTEGYAFDGRQPAEPSGSEEIRSREDAVYALERVCEFLETHEPANPAPLLIRRAQRLLQMSFVEIMRDLAPEGLSSIEKISGMSMESE